MGLGDVVHAARPIGQALLCLSINANGSIKLKPGLLACPASQYNKKYNECGLHKFVHYYIRVATVWKIRENHIFWTPDFSRIGSYKITHVSPLPLFLENRA